MILVQLEKGSKGLGITLGSGNDIDSDYVFIKKIVPGSVAEENGQLRIRDRLICVSCFRIFFGKLCTAYMRPDLFTILI